VVSRKDQPGPVVEIERKKGAAPFLLGHSQTSVLPAQGVPSPAISARLGRNSIRTTTCLLPEAPGLLAVAKKDKGRPW
jgi:hypothetical protein